MTTFKFSGNMGYSDDTKLWREMVDKEHVANNNRINHNFLK